MYKIRKVKFHNHPVLQNLELNFCDKNGKAVDTVILAGENGVGKSIVLNSLYQVASHKVNELMDVEFDCDGVIFSLSYRLEDLSPERQAFFAHNNKNQKTFVSSDRMRSQYPFSGIFSDVDINFHANDISKVTSLTLDENKDSRRSSENLPSQIHQLIIDIQTMDDSELAFAVRNTQNKDTPISELVYQERIPRFTMAFNQMFEELTYNRVENANGKKAIVFQKNGIDVPIDALSSGEKQIVYRGCFLLRDVNAINGAFVFIDEPEISLHPRWQMKVMDFYKGIFTNKFNEQTSQIFVATHSPFVIHNDNRFNDKVIVLSRDEDGTIYVQDKPEYFACNSLEVIQDAFNINDFSDDCSEVLLEGQTDEKYFNKALEVYEYNVPLKFRWIGHIGEGGKACYTGKDALSNAVKFLKGMNLSTKKICLYDCDANKKLETVGNIIIKSIMPYENSKGIKIGIENALILENIDIDPFKKQNITIDDYGIERRIPDFQKMECCDYICGLDNEQLKEVFVNLKAVIDEILELVNAKT